MLREIRPAVTIMLALTVLCGLAYPLLVTGIAQAVFAYQANGSLVVRDRQVTGSALLGQNFSTPRYFHGRPSATTDTDPADASKTIPAPYNAANSSGSNLAPTAKALVDRVAADVEALHRDAPGVKVPADLVTTSASGLDPDLSPEAALAQVRRVAAARGLAEARVWALVQRSVQQRMLGVLGEKRVNVLELNLALDALK